MRVTANPAGGTDYTANAKEIALILEDILRGRTPTRIARERGVPESVVVATRDAHGYPSAAELRKAVAELLPLAGQAITFTAPTPTKGAPVPTPQPPAPAKPTPEAQPDPPNAATSEKAERKTIEQLISAARHHDVPRIKRLGEKIAALVDDLNEQIVADEADAQRRSRIAQLKKELAELEGKGGAGASIYGCEVDGCDKTFPSKQGRATHTTRVHGSAAA